MAAKLPNNEYFTPYPTHIIVPEGYWTITTTIGEKDNPNKYWHNGEDD